MRLPGTTLMEAPDGLIVAYEASEHVGLVLHFRPGRLSMTAKPIPWLAGQLTKACSRSSVSLDWHILHIPLTVGLVLDTLSWVGRISCTTLNKKLISADPRPGNLALCHVVSQSYSEFLISTLQGTSSLSSSAMVW